MAKHKVIILIMVFAFGAFAQIQPKEFYHLYSKQQRSSAVQSSSFPPYSYKFAGNERFSADSVEIYAIRIEFKPDSVINTTGNGLFMREKIESHEAATKEIASSLGFNIPLSRTDRKEFSWYADGKTYKYDKIPHDYTYFYEHLTSLRNYYREVSNDGINIGWEIFPAETPDTKGFASFRLSQEMAYFSPGQKRRDETYDDFNVRKTRAMMRFVAQSIFVADSSGKLFNSLQQDENGNLFKFSESGKTIPVFVLIIHAGSSALTDGGEGGAGNADSPNDLTDMFVGEELFRFFNLPHENIFGNFVKKDSLTGRTGMQISGKDGKTLTLSELMMVSETANQDSLNWGINGILVNQFARQIGIPDLFSTSSGITGIGRFGIMDFSGYSTANGFIPPNPSAFVRAFMGWEKPIHAKVGSEYLVNVLETNLFLVPINNTEYYLIENRQRNLTQNPDLFVYDTINGKPYITPEFWVNLDENVKNKTTTRSVVMEVESRDIGIPASGICVWHIDEKLIENRLKHNMINADSSYRAVNLVEADGITDIGIQFTDMLGYPWYDYGSAADVFPHTNNFLNKNDFKIIDSTSISDFISPQTAPATIANDGGNSFLKMKFANTKKGNAEKYFLSKGQNDNSKFNRYEVINYSDTTIKMSISQEVDNIIPVKGFPVKIQGETGYFPFLTANIKDGNGNFKIIAISSRNGNLTILSANGNIIVNENIGAIDMPTMVGGSLFVPNKNRIMIYSYDEAAKKFVKDSTETINISSYIVGITDSIWAIGTKGGEVIFGKGKTITNKTKIAGSPVNAIAKIGFGTDNTYRIAVVCENGIVSTYCHGFGCGIDDYSAYFDEITLPNAKKAFPPFKIAIVNNFFVVSDSKNGLWFFDEKGQMLTDIAPIDWAGVFREESGRENIPNNDGYISAADLNNDGFPEIIIGGTNGVYAFDYKGNLLANYPAVLDRADWNIRKSVLATPITAKNEKGETMVFFTTTTGDTKSYYQTQIIDSLTDVTRGIVFFKDINGNLDSISGFTKAEIDTIMKFNDGIILPYFAPGGLIEIRDGKTGKRPDLTISTDNAGKKRIFPYLVSIGSPLSQSVVLDSINGALNIIAISDDGMLYRFALPKDKFPENQTNMVGGNAQRHFSFTATDKIPDKATENLEYFYSYPNPVRISQKENTSVNFRYELGGNASSAMLTIYTIQGQKVFEEKNLPLTRGVNEFVLNDLSRFGSAVYRCRLSVKFGSNEKVLFWKMAVLR